MTFLTFSAKPLLQISYPRCPNTQTQNRPSRRDRFKCHTPSPHNMRLTELILPHQEQRPHIVQTPWIVTHSDTQLNQRKTWAVISLCRGVFWVLGTPTEELSSRFTGRQLNIWTMLHKQPWIQLLCRITLSLFLKSTAQHTKNSFTIATQ